MAGDDDDKLGDDGDAGLHKLWYPGLVLVFLQTLL